MGILPLNGFLILEQIRRTLLFILSTLSVYIRWTEFVEKKRKKTIKIDCLGLDKSDAEFLTITWWHKFCFFVEFACYTLYSLKLKGKQHGSFITHIPSPFWPHPCYFPPCRRLFNHTGLPWVHLVPFRPTASDLGAPLPRMVLSIRNTGATT